VVLVHPGLPVRSIGELIALAKREPGTLNYASAGVGSGIHLGTVLFEQMADIKLTHVPYRGSAPALTDLMGGHVAIYFSSLPPAIGLAHDGKVRALAVTGARRSGVLADLPTVAEAGLPGYESVLHYGIVAPAFLTMADHLVSSQSMSAAYWSGVLGSGSVPSAAMRSLVSAALSASRSAPLSLSMTRRGVPAGATIP